MPFDPTTSKHSIANALVLAKISQLAYSDEPAIRAGIAAIVGQPLRDFKFFHVPFTDTEAFLAGFDNAIVLAFRGSQSLQDWLQDGQIALVPFHKGGLVHIGFRDAVDSVHSLIESTLKEWSGKGRTLWITGHSLGGALAMLTAAYLRFPADPTKTLPRPLAGLYTFGQPRVGTVPFCDACSADFGSFYFRYVNNQDIVTRVPPRELGYWHTGHDEYIDPNDKIHEDPAWWQIFIDRIKVGVSIMQDIQAGKFTIDPKKANVPPVTDHFMTNYIARIEKNVR
jgi:triacylglycerol lipase